MLTLPTVEPAIPILESERLILRGHRRDDFEDSAAMWRDTRVVRYISGKPSSSEESWRRLLTYRGHWSLMGFGFWALIEKSSGRFMGEAGFSDFKREVEPSFDGAPEIGWVLAPWAHGQGFATEAVRAAVAWGDAQFGAERTLCMIHPDNRASQRVATKCGYREFARASYGGNVQVVLERRAHGDALDQPATPSRRRS